jgi:chromosome segregation ATPase
VQELKRQVLDLRDRVLSAEQHASAEAASRELQSLSPAREPRPQSSALPRATAEQVAAAATAASAGALELQQLLMATTVKLQHKDGQARKYKEAVRTLKSRLTEAEASLGQRQGQISAMQAELGQLRAAVQGLSVPAAAASAKLQELQRQLVDRWVVHVKRDAKVSIAPVACWVCWHMS